MMDLIEATQTGQLRIDLIAQDDTEYFSIFNNINVKAVQDNPATYKLDFDELQYAYGNAGMILLINSIFWHLSLECNRY